MTDAAALADTNLFHTTLAELLCKAPEGSVSHVNRTSLRGNWRTRQVICGLKGLNSIADFFLREDEFRNVLMSQETRRRVKLFNAFLSGQFFVEERDILRDEEQRCRRSLSSALHVVLRNYKIVFTFVMSEMHHRNYLEEKFMTERLDYCNCFYVTALELLERRSRQEILQMEVINRIETEKRRFLAVGREIDMELLRQQLCRFTVFVSMKTTKLIHDVALLSTEEERQRCSIERLYLLKLSLIANDQENTAARLVVNSVMKASLMRRKLRDDVRWREYAAKLLLFPSKESDIRCIIERKEMEERQEIRVNFMITWRDIYKRSDIIFEGCSVIESLELYERRCLCDQWRFVFNTLYEQQMREKSFLMQREAVYDMFFHSVADSLTALWKQEGEQFNLIRKSYFDFVSSNWRLQASAVLDVEECCARNKIIEAEAEERVNIHAALCLSVFEENALRKIASIMTMEADCYTALMQWNFGTIQGLLFERLLSEEEFCRIDIESMASAMWVDIVMKENLCWGFPVTSLERIEKGQRTLHVEEERSYFLNRGLRFLICTEYSNRRILEQEELFHRLSKYMLILQYVEEWNRMELEIESKRVFSSITLSCLENREQIMRKVIEDSEQQRHSFLFDSFDYFFLHLRACEVDELNDRLDIVHEAQLVMGALAYTRGVRWRLASYLEELQKIQGVMHFMSLKELLQDNEMSMVTALEPFSRGKITRSETFERLLLTLEAREQCGRFKIEERARNAYTATCELFDRVIFRADQWRTRGELRDVVVLSGREALIDYFRRHETLYAVKFKAQRGKIRKLLVSFFQCFYWSRDTIVVEEFVGRQEIMNSFSRPQLVLHAAGQGPPSRVIVQLYSFAITANVKPGLLFVRVFDSIDDVGVSFELCEVQAVSAAGCVFCDYFPLRPVEWVRSLEVESLVVYFEVKEKEGNTTATASLFLRSDDLRRTSGSSLVSLFSDNNLGKINVLLHVE